MTTSRRFRRLTRQHPCKQSVRTSVRGLEPRPGGGRLHGQVPPAVPTGQRISDLKKAEGNGESRQAPEPLQTPDPGTPDEPAPPDQPATPDQPEEPETP